MAKKLLALSGYPGVGKSTLAREIVKQIGGFHFDLDFIKKDVVPANEVTEGIDPPEIRKIYYSKAIEMLPTFFDFREVVIVEEIFHLQSLRELWDDACKKMEIDIQWIDVVCDNEIVKKRLELGVGRENHLLNTEQTLKIYKMFEEVFEPLNGNHITINTGENILFQIKNLL